MSEPPAPTSAAPTTEEPPEPEPDRGRKGLPLILEIPLLVLVAFALALLLKTFVVQAFYIPSSSMVPTLEVNDRVLVNKLSANARDPERGEVIVFQEEGTGEPGLRGTVRDVAAGLGLVPPAQKDFIKRVIGLPGEEVELRGGVVYIDGEELAEDTVEEGGYLAARSNDDFGPVEIPDGEYFLMGDNRPNSADSRSTLGTVERDEIIGRAFVRIWPPSRMGGMPIANYFTADAAVRGFDLGASEARGWVARAGPRAVA